MIPGIPVMVSTGPRRPRQRSSRDGSISPRLSLTGRCGSSEGMMARMHGTMSGTRTMVLTGQKQPRPPGSPGGWHLPAPYSTTGCGCSAGMTGISGTVFDNRLWAIGGSKGHTMLNDAWYSTDGIQWTEATPAAEFAPRAGQASPVYDNRMWVIGGTDPTHVMNDTWYSTDGTH